VKRIAVSFGIDGNGLYPHAAGGLDDAAGDLAAICDQNFLEHGFALATLGGGNLAWRDKGNNSVVQQNATEATVYVHPARLTPSPYGFQPELV
jgi:hypothetical protein